MTLSEASRRDAIDALSQLSLRLSHSSLTLLLGGGTHRPDKSGAKPKPRRTKSGDGKSAPGSKKGDIKRITAANASAPQLAIIRPKHRRSASAAPAPRSPPPPATPKPPHRRTQSAAAAPTLSPAAAARLKSAPHPAPAQQQQQQLAIALPPGRAAAPPSHHQQQQHYGTTATQTADWTQAARRRRAEQATPSVYTFASDSTKVGEIPMARWAEPFDFEAMARLNAEAATRAPLNPAVAVGGGRVVKRRGFLGLFRKTAPAEA
jgi:hypothetical protein